MDEVEVETEGITVGFETGLKVVQKPKATPVRDVLVGICRKTATQARKFMTTFPLRFC